MKAYPLENIEMFLRGSVQGHPYEGKNWRLEKRGKGRNFSFVLSGDAEDAVLLGDIHRSLEKSLRNTGWIAIYSFGFPSFGPPARTIRQKQELSQYPAITVYRISR